MSPELDQERVFPRRWLERLFAHPDARIAIALAAVVFGLSYLCDATYPSATALAESHQHMGGEYFNIARAIVDGRGFSDPFGEATGPTAWMPPLYSWILAALLVLLRSRALTAMAVLALSNLTYVSIGVTLCVIARAYARRIPAPFVLLFYVCWLGVFRFWTFILTHDIWLQALEVNLVLILIHQWVQSGTVRPLRWGLLGGLLVLSSPALTFAYACLIVGIASLGGARRRWIAALALMAALTVPWTVRNLVAFDRLIPTKSNLFFDAYQGNVVDADGVYDNATMAKHPFGNTLLRFQYAKLGESRFVDHEKQEFFRLLSQRPGTYAIKVLHRAIAAFGVYWSLGQPDVGANLIAEQVLYPMPVIAFSVLLLFSGPARRLAQWCGIFCLAYLSPYVAIAYYIRYALPLTSLFSIVVFLAADRVAGIWWSDGGGTRRFSAVEPTGG